MKRYLGKKIGSALVALGVWAMLWGDRVLEKYDPAPFNPFAKPRTSSWYELAASELDQLLVETGRRQRIPPPPPPKPTRRLNSKLN